MRRHRRPWWATSDEQYHRNRHMKHAVINWWHVFLGAVFIMCPICGIVGRLFG